MECEAPVALAVVVSAREGASSSAKQQGPWGQQVAPELISVGKAAGQNDRQGGPGMALFKWPVFGTRAADDVLDPPARPLRDEACGGASSDSLLGFQPQRFTNWIWRAIG
jgi:hypothetical protein